MEKIRSLFKNGLKDGLPIGLGYLPVAFTLGISGANMKAFGLKLYHSLSMGLLSFTGVGQMNTLEFMKSKETYIGIFLSLLVIHLRNIVLSLTMAQKLDPKTKFGQKLVIAMGNTDEIFALTIRKEGKIPAKYFLGVMSLPYISWFIGLLLGGVASNLLPENVIIAMQMALYAMLIAAVIPASKESKPVLYVATISGVLSCILLWLGKLFSDGKTPFESFMATVLKPSGVMIIGSLLSAVLVALKFPTKSEEEK